MLGITDYAAYCGTFLIFLALPGPGTLALLTSTARGGLRAGGAATLGIIVGDQVWLWLAAAGMTGLLAAHPDAFKALQFAGAAYLIWIGLRLLVVRDRPAPTVRTIQPRAYFRQAIWITLLNPKAIVFYLAFITLYLNPLAGSTLLTYAVMAATNIALTAVYCLALCACSVNIKAQLVQHRSIGPWLRRIAGGLLVTFGLRLAS